MKLNSKIFSKLVVCALVLSSTALFAADTTVSATVQVNATTALTTNASTITFVPQTTGLLPTEITSTTTTLTSVYGGSSQTGQKVTAVPAPNLVGVTDATNTIAVTFYAAGTPIISGDKVITTAAAVDDTATVDINAKIAAGINLPADFFSGNIVFTSSSGA